MYFIEIKKLLSSNAGISVLKPRISKRQSRRSRIYVLTVNSMNCQMIRPIRKMLLIRFPERNIHWI